jgi:hypothetical protein
MTNNTERSVPEVVVTQADREAADQAAGDYGLSVAQYDLDPLREAFALHRTEAEARATRPGEATWRLVTDEKPPLHRQVLVELREGVGQVCDVACYVGRFDLEGGGVEDRWILTDVRLDSRQIKRWAPIYPVPPRSEIDAAVKAALASPTSEDHSNAG